MNTKEPIANSTEIMNRINRFTSDADWTIEELRESLRADGIDPDQALNNIKMRIAPFVKLKEASVAETNQVSQTASSTGIYTGIMAAAKKLGLTQKRFAEITGLSETLLIKLDRRLISLEGFSKVAAAVASALQTTEQTIENYVGGKALYPAEANFKAEEVPDLPQKQSFAEAVKTDPLLSEDAKQRLLDLQDNK
jgi:hypothetical protein